MAASTKKRRSPNKSKAILLELGAIHTWMKDHERFDDERFGEAKEKMNTLATKDDISTVMVDQASKADMSKLSRLLLDEEGLPKFATKEDMLPVLNLYKGSTFVKSLFAGVAAFVITLVAVGFAIIQLVAWFKGTPQP